MHHFRKTYKDYTKKRRGDTKQAGCTYCIDPTFQERTVQETETMRVVVIRTTYDIFEGRPVEDHLMVVPKRHVESIAEFTDQEAVESVRLIGEYEAKGYNAYSRGKGSVSRSVAHQHTHLIKLKEVHTKFLLYIKKPYHLLQF